MHYEMKKLEFELLPLETKRKIWNCLLVFAMMDACYASGDEDEDDECYVQEFYKFTLPLRMVNKKWNEQLCIELFDTLTDLQLLLKHV